MSLKFEDVTETRGACEACGAYHTWTQPIWDLQTDRAIGAEVLSRNGAGTVPEGLIAPGADSAEAWALEAALIDVAAATLNRTDSDGLVFINCSPPVIEDERLTDHLRGFCDRSGIHAEHVVIEITEGRPGTDEAMVTRGAFRLREAGFQLAIDDLGADGSGLARVAGIHPDWIKIDRGLIEAIDRGAVGARLVEAVCDFGAQSGIPLIAEGIERPAQLAFLRSMGIGYGQGFLLGMPRPAAPQGRAA